MLNTAQAAPRIGDDTAADMVDLDHANVGNAKLQREPVRALSERLERVFLHSFARMSEQNLTSLLLARGVSVW